MVDWTGWLQTINMTALLDYYTLWPMTVLLEYLKFTLSLSLA